MTEEFDRSLIADMLREYAASVERSGEDVGGYTIASLREQADLIEASEGRAVTACNGVTSEQVDRGYAAAVHRKDHGGKSFNSDIRGMVRAILEAGRGR